MSLILPARHRLGRDRLRPLSRLPLSRLLLRQEYMVAVGRVSGLEQVQQPWSTFLSRELVTDAVAEYIADPFLLRRGATFYLFFEVLNLRTGRGEISVAHSSDLRRWVYGGVALRERCHLSYPYVFEHAGETYMVPESSERGAISLYRAQDFPRRWERVGDLLSGEAFVDASLFREERPGGGHWWLVTSIPTSPRPLVYRADKLLGSWVPVPVEVAGDGDLLRSAGRIFQLGGQWYRPVQRRGQVYGEEVWLRRIELGAHGYREELARGAPQPLLAPGQSRPAPGWNSLGMHHLDLQPDGDTFLAAVDGKALVLDTSPLRLLLRLRNKVLRIGRP